MKKNVGFQGKFRYVLIFLLFGMIVISNPVESREYSWNFTVIDTDGDAGGYCSLAFSPKTGYPAISYTEFVSKNLRIAWYNGTSWTVNRHLSENASYNQIFFNSSGNPAIVFYSGTPLKSVKFIKSDDFDWADSGLWYNSIIQSGMPETVPGIVYNSSDTPLVSYINKNLKLSFSYQFGNSWYNNEIFSSGLKYTSIAVNPVTGLPEIAYAYDPAREVLHYRRYDGVTWDEHGIIHNSDGTGYSCSLAFNSSGYPGVSYIRKGTGDLYYAWHDGSSWNHILVDDVSTYRTVPYTKLAYNKSDCPGISYYDGRGGTNGDLKYAACTIDNIDNMSLWEIETVYSDCDSGLYNSFGFDPQTDLPFIAFYRQIEGSSYSGSLYFGMKGAKPGPDFTAYVSPGITNMTVSFFDMTYSQTPASGWLWDFGDNTTYSGQSPPVHKYQSAGIYQVSLSATNMFGVSEITKNVVVPPYSDFYANITSGIAPLEVNFTDKSKGMPEMWNLSFGDGNFYNTTGYFPAGLSHVYENAGYYTVSLSTERNGIYNTTTYENLIAAGINASFSADSLSGFAPLKVSFNDTSQGSPDMWEWDFDDGTISHEKNTTHTFLSPGIYYVTLNASSGVFSDKYSCSIKVGENPSSGSYGSLYYSEQESLPETDSCFNISTACGYDLKTGDVFSFIINTGVIKKFSAAVGENINRVKFEVEKITDWEGLFKPPLLPVYGYEKIRIYWAPESSIVTSSVSFDVSREWLLRKSMTKDDVTFLMYSSKNSTWAGLPVEYKGCNDDYCSYSARIPEFSYYAVGAEKNTVHMPENSIEVKGLEAKSKTNSLETTKNSSLAPAKTPDSSVEYLTDTRAMPLYFVNSLFSLFLVLFLIRKFRKE